MKEDTATIGGEIAEKTSDAVGLYGTFMKILPEVMLALIAFAVFFVISRVVRKVVRKAMARTSTEGHVDILVAQIAYIGTLTIGVLVSLGFFEVNLTGLFASLGVAGFAIGFAMKDILGNFLSGIILLTQRPFTIGDFVIIDNVEGEVTNIRIRDTQITTYDGRVVFIPNNTLSTSNIINLTALPLRRVDIDVGVSYGSDLGMASKVCLDAVRKVSGVVDDPAPDVLVTAFADSAVMLRVRVWADYKNAGFLEVRSDAHKAIKEALDNAGIEIPFPIRTVYFRQTNGFEDEIEEIAGGKSRNKR